MPQSSSDANSAAMVELHAEQGSHSSEQFVPGGESDQEDAKLEISLMRLPFGLCLLSLFKVLMFPHKPHIFLWDAGIVTWIRSGPP